MKADSQIFLLFSFLYKKLQNEDFEKLNRWVKWLFWDHFWWVFVICQEKNHWVAVKIDWKNVSILYYDSKAQKRFSHSFCREKTVDISNILESLQSFANIFISTSRSEQIIFIIMRTKIFWIENSQIFRTSCKMLMILIIAVSMSVEFWLSECRKTV